MSTRVTPRTSLLPSLFVIMALWGVLMLVVLTGCSTTTTAPPLTTTTTTPPITTTTTLIPNTDIPFSMTDLWGITGQEDPPGSHPTGQTLLDLMTAGDL